MGTDFDKLYKDIRRDSSNKIYMDLRDKEKAKNYVRPDKRDLGIFEQGLEWFNSGLPLEDAPQELRKNTNFINGFNKGNRLAMIAEKQEKDRNPGR